MANEKQFKTEIVKTSMEMTVKERIKYRDLSNSIKLDEVATPEVPYIIENVKDFVVVHTHNEFVKEGDNTDYDTLVIIDSEGRKFTTSSERFIEDFIDYYETIKGAGEEFGLEVCKMPSKNYKNKFFLTPCVI